MPIHQLYQPRKCDILRDCLQAVTLISDKHAQIHWSTEVLIGKIKKKISIFDPSGNLNIALEILILQLIMLLCLMGWCNHCKFPSFFVRVSKTKNRMTE